MCCTRSSMTWTCTRCPSTVVRQMSSTSRGRAGNLEAEQSPALVAQGIERRTPKPGVAGSNPAGGTYSDGRYLALADCRRRTQGDEAVDDLPRAGGQPVAGGLGELLGDGQGTGEGQRHGRRIYAGR